MYQKFYQHFLNANKNIQHFACHSHHYWPDVTRDAQIRYWDDSAKYVDQKWEYFFTQKIPNVQNLIATELNIKNPQSIVFAPNTHEFVFRLISSLDKNKTNNVLTTDSEFHSFDRQVNRSKEEAYLNVSIVPTQPFDNFESRFIDMIKKTKYDLIFLSHVFFNSGMALKNLNNIIQEIKHNETIIVIDGYHSFMALPIDLSEIEDRVFFLGGSYKYAQGGEGACFMVCPKNSKLRPEYTGWFAELEKIDNHSAEVFYPDSALRFAGSTMDFSALYRLESVLELFKENDITSSKIHKYIQSLQKSFLEELSKYDHHYIREKNILSVDYNHHGHFFTFALPSNEHAKRYHQSLREKNIITDFRGSRLRFGFGLYHSNIYDLSALKVIN